MRGIYFWRQIVHFWTFSCAFGITHVDYQDQLLKQKWSRHANINKSCHCSSILIHHPTIHASTCATSNHIVLSMRGHIPVLVGVPHTMSAGPAGDATPLTILNPTRPFNRCVTTPLDAPCRDVFMHMLVVKFEAQAALNLQFECTKCLASQLSRTTSVG